MRSQALYCISAKARSLAADHGRAEGTPKLEDELAAIAFYVDSLEERLFRSIQRNFVWSIVAAAACDFERREHHPDGSFELTFSVTTANKLLEIAGFRTRIVLGWTPLQIINAVTEESNERPELLFQNGPGARF